MQSTVRDLEGLKREVTVIIPVQEVQSLYQKKILQVSKQAKINGFRPGKVPVDIIEQRFGNSVLGEIANELIEQNIEKAMSEHKLRIAGTPSLTEMSIKKNQPCEFKLVVEVYPEIDVKLLSGVAIEREHAEITEADFQYVLEKIQKKNAEYKVIERAVQMNDRVLIDFDGSIAGVAFEGGSSKAFTLDLGSESMIPGFEAAIVGMTTGESRVITVTFPENYQTENLKGKQADFTILLHKIEETVLPPVDDALAENMQVKGGVEALKTKIREGMQRELKEQLKARLKERVFDKLLELNEILVPAATVEAEVKHVKKMSLQRLADQYGMELKELEKLNVPDAPYYEQADRRVRLGLIVAEVIKKFDIKTDEEALNERIKDLSAHFEEPSEVEEWYLTNEEARFEIEASVVEDLTVEKLLSDAQVTDKYISYKDAVNNS